MLLRQDVWARRWCKCFLLCADQEDGVIFEQLSPLWRRGRTGKTDDNNAERIWSDWRRVPPVICPPYITWNKDLKQAVRRVSRLQWMAWFFFFSWKGFRAVEEGDKLKAEVFELWGATMEVASDSDIFMPYGYLVPRPSSTCPRRPSSTWTTSPWYKSLSSTCWCWGCTWTGAGTTLCTSPASGVNTSAMPAKPWGRPGAGQMWSKTLTREWLPAPSAF